MVNEKSIIDPIDVPPIPDGWIIDWPHPVILSPPDEIPSTFWNGWGSPGGGR